MVLQKTRLKTEAQSNSEMAWSHISRWKTNLLTIYDFFSDFYVHDNWKVWLFNTQTHELSYNYPFSNAQYSAAQFVAKVNRK